jgi:uncharacterized protein (TIGR02246 family)
MRPATAIMTRWILCTAAAVLLAAAATPCRAQATALSPLESAIVRESEATVKAFNAADAAALGAMFLENGELVDESGTAHAGKAAITELFKGFFTNYPKSVLEMQVMSVRPIGDAIAVEEGERRITAADGASAARVRYVTVRSKQGDRWPIASYREFSDNPLPTPQEMLQGVSWLEGDWVDESPEGRTTISFRRSEDGNFLLGDYDVALAGGPTSKTTQRIGWDPVAGQLRSWTFDSDGGFSQGEWTAIENGWVVKSEATMPDGTTGSATMTITVKDADHFVVRSSDRIVGGVEEPDFEVTIARKPPMPGAKK